MKKRAIFAIIFLLLAAVAGAKTLIVAETESSLYFAVGKHFFNQGDFSSAIDYFKKSVELDNNFEEAYHNLAISYYKTGNLQKALENFEDAILVNPKYSRAYYSLGLLYFEKDDSENAVLNFQKAVELEGTQNQQFDLAAAYVARFRSKEGAGKISSADLDDLRSAISHFEKAQDVPNAASNLEIVRQVISDYESQI